MNTQKQPPIPADFWQAIIENNPAFDDRFFYGVATTGIFCRPSCKSRLPHKDNVRIFNNAYIALAEGFRPCKRCKPDGLNLPADEWVQHITEWIDDHFTEDVSLEKLADIAHGSPYHLQRLFTKTKGLSPTAYIQELRLEKAARDLRTTKLSVEAIGKAAGFSNTPYFITLFKKKKGETPGSFRKGVNSYEPNR
ncbi:bifunctional transcriptional activator/DNA repair enzyme AdaA [Planococcus sp. YIM B11945]|uniref:bifunctional transcriptional activator/DNA repair enzyme AdaA n=1 Tax=Planococcus sp. YIM B11945 TaxID=3435410 RepID=UPI003D7DEDF4